MTCRFWCGKCKNQLGTIIAKKIFFDSIQFVITKLIILSVFF